MYTPDTQPVRPVDQLRTTPYADMNSAEINKFRQEDPAAFEAMVTALDAPPVVVPAEGEVAAPLPMSKARQIYRNGELVDTATAVRYVNGIPV
jgi:hypothetical protein